MISALSVTRMNFDASPTVHENAPSSAPPIDPKIEPDGTTSQCAPTGAAPADAVSSSSHAAASASVTVTLARADENDMRKRAGLV